MYIVYVLHSEKHDKIYIGYTSNLEERLLSHNKLGNKGWTINFRPWKLIHCEEFSDKSPAMKREKELKSSRGRNFIRTKTETAATNLSDFSKSFFMFIFCIRTHDTLLNCAPLLFDYL